MSNFEMMTRPKKPMFNGSLERDLWNGMTLQELIREAEAFRDQYPHLTPKDILLEFYYDGDTVCLTAQGKTQAQYTKELKAYDKKLKVYNKWRTENAAAILNYKAEEKKRIAQAKLERTKDRLNKELAAVEAKLVKQ